MSTLSNFGGSHEEAQVLGMGERRLRDHDDVHGLQAQVGVFVGALVHSDGSVAVIINSALLLSWKRRGDEEDAGRA